MHGHLGLEGAAASHSGGVPPRIAVPLLPTDGTLHSLNRFSTVLPSRLFRGSYRETEPSGKPGRNPHLKNPLTESPQRLLKSKVLSLSAEVAKLVYAEDLKSSAERLTGSSPVLGTI